MENTSGSGKIAEIPVEIKGWNWGAFLLNWIWGISNNTYIALLMFVPLINIAMPFVLGAKGNTWAWQNKKWDDINHFKGVQKRWRNWGLIVIIAYSVFYIALFFGINSLMKSSEAYQLALQEINANPEINKILGEPIEAGMLRGSIETSGPSGKASISIPLKGTKTKGIAYVKAIKEMGIWKIQKMEVEIKPNGKRIVIIE